MADFVGVINYNCDINEFISYIKNNKIDVTCDKFSILKNLFELGKDSSKYFLMLCQLIDFIDHNEDTYNLMSDPNIFFDIKELIIRIS